MNAVISLFKNDTILTAQNGVEHIGLKSPQNAEQNTINMKLKFKIKTAKPAGKEGFFLYG